MNAVLILLVATVALAALVFFFRERPVWAALVSAIGTLLLAIFVILAPIESPVEIAGLSLRFGSTLRILGRAITLAGAARAQVALLYFLCAYFLAGSITDKPGRYFHSAAIVCLLMLVISLMIQPFLFAAIFLVLAAMSAVVILTSAVEPARWGSLQLLILYTLAMMVILITGWMLENIGVTASTTNLAQRAIVLLAIGFAILMIIPPFHFWLPSSALRINFFVLAFVAIILQSSGQFFLLGFFETYSWMRMNPMVYDSFLIAGSIVVLGGAIFAMAQIQLEKFIAYVLLVEFGFSLLAIASALSSGQSEILGFTVSRVLIVASLALGVSLRRKSIRDAEFGYSRRTEKIILGTIFIGMLSLVGFPLTGGFPFKWSLLADFSSVDFRVSIVIWMAMLILFLGSIRWIWALSRERIADPALGSTDLTRLDQGIIWIGLAMSLLVGVFPQLVYPWLRSVIIGMQNLFG